jgi:hypothetical protein
MGSVVVRLARIACWAVVEPMSDLASDTLARWQSMKSDLPFVEHNGVRYYLMRHGYYMNARGAYLHRVVWAEANGVIPWRHQVHHKNKDRGDNRLENLECMHVTDHMRLHGREPKKKSNRSFGPAECTECGKAFEKTRPTSLRCSRACTVKAGNRLRHVRLSEQRAKAREGKVCGCCGAPFVAKASNAKFCSVRCCHAVGSRRYNSRHGLIPRPHRYRVGVAKAA